MNKDLAASVRARLLSVAKAQGADFNQVLVRFALERILYRLSQSAHADRFLLKGALPFTLWYDMPHRTTRENVRLIYPCHLWCCRPYGNVSHKVDPGAERKDRSGRWLYRGTGDMAVAARNARPPARAQVPASFRPGRRVPGALRQRIRQGRTPANWRQGDALSLRILGQAAARF